MTLQDIINEDWNDDACVAYVKIPGTRRYRVARGRSEDIEDVLTPEQYRAALDDYYKRNAPVYNWDNSDDEDGEPQEGIL
jgi:hypothetical protein